MKATKKITISALIFTLIVSIFAVTCALVYIYKWNDVAFWWSWIGAAWLIDLVVGIYIFSKRKISDGNKAFWLFMMILIPLAGAFIALVYVYKTQTLFDEPNNNHSLMLASIFKAKHSIKIYSSSFFVPIDIFKALNMASFKDVKVEIIISVQEKEKNQRFLEWKLKKCLEKDVKVYFTNKQSDNSFIIIDDKYVLTTNLNFNFTNIFRNAYMRVSDKPQTSLESWKEYSLKASEFDFVNLSFNKAKNFKYKVINIFYAFF